MNTKPSLHNVVALSEGYKGIIDAGEGLEWADAVFALVETWFDRDENPHCDVSYHGTFGDRLLAVQTPLGRVVMNGSEYSSLEHFNQEHSDFIWRKP